MSALNISERDSVFESAATAARGNKWDSQSQRGTERFGHKWSWSRNISGIGLFESGTKGLIQNCWSVLVRCQGIFLGPGPEFEFSRS